MVDRRFIAAFALGLTGVGAMASVLVPAYAQTATDLLAKKTQAPGKKPGDKLVVESKELVYDRDNDTISAVRQRPALLPGPRA